MKNPDCIYKTYDIVLDETGQIRLDFYETRIETEGKEICYVHELRKSEYSENLENDIAILRGWNYLGMNSFRANSWDITSKNPLLVIKMILLSKQHKILEKSYDAHTIDADGLNCITKYIYYVNMQTGKQFVMNIGVEKHSEENICNLQGEGFKPIEDSVLTKSAVLFSDDQISKR